MRILVCGGQNFGTVEQMNYVLDLYLPPLKLEGSAIIHGGATGADTMAGQWARENGVKEEPYPINDDDRAWGNGVAGNRRNQRMLDASKPDLVLAFLGGTGTFDMVTRARLKGVPVTELGPWTPVAEGSEG